LAVLNPLLNGSVFIPSIISGKDFDSRHAFFSEDFILLVEKSDSLFGCLILIDTDFNLLKEGLFSLDVMMLFNDISVSCR